MAQCATSCTADHNKQLTNDAYEVDSDIDEEMNESECPFMGVLLNVGGAEAIYTMLNFTVYEFHEVWRVAQPTVDGSWNNTRVPRPGVPAKDMLFIVWNVVHHPSTWDR